MDAVGIVIFSTALIGSNLFWAIVVNRLINKLMSRDFTEYNLNQTKPKARNQEQPEPKVDPIAEQWTAKRTKEVNGLFGL